MSELSVLRAPRIHPAWWVAAVTFLALGRRGRVPGRARGLMEPLHHEFGWSISTVAVAVSMALYGLTPPFAAALMERFGLRPVVTAALLVVAGSGLTGFMTG